MCIESAQCAQDTWHQHSSSRVGGDHETGVGGSDAGAGGCEVELETKVKRRLVRKDFSIMEKGWLSVLKLPIHYDNCVGVSIS